MYQELKIHVLINRLGEKPLNYDKKKVSPIEIKKKCSKQLICCGFHSNRTRAFSIR